MVTNNSKDHSKGLNILYTNSTRKRGEYMAENTVLSITLAVIVGTLAAIVYSLRILVLMERRVARMEQHIERIALRIVEEELTIERKLGTSKKKRTKRRTRR